MICQRRENAPFTVAFFIFLIEIADQSNGTADQLLKRVVMSADLYRFILAREQPERAAVVIKAIESGGNPGFIARPKRTGLVLRSSRRMIVSSTDWPQSV